MSKNNLSTPGQEHKQHSQFIINLLDVIFDLSRGFIDAFRRESWHYKDLRMGGYDPQKIYSHLNNLKQRGIVKSDGKGIFTLTPMGRNWARQSVSRYFPLYQRKWDRKWRVIIFDIPQELHNVRTKFRKKLQSFGFYMLQKSVFVFPYNCEGDLGDIAQELKISDYIDIIVAENIGFKEKELREYYNL